MSKRQQVIDELASLVDSIFNTVEELNKNKSWDNKAIELVAEIIEGLGICKESIKTITGIEN